MIFEELQRAQELLLSSGLKIFNYTNGCLYILVPFHRDLISQYLWYSGQPICVIQWPMPILGEQFSQWRICNASITLLLLLLFAFDKIQQLNNDNDNNK